MKLLYSALCLAIGIFLVVWVKKRQFKRVNNYGFEQHESYRAKVVTTAVEKVAWSIAFTCIALGSFLAL